MSAPKFYVAFQPAKGGRRYWSGSTYRGPDTAFEFRTEAAAREQMRLLKSDPAAAGCFPGYSEWLGHCSDLFVTTELI